MQAQCLPVDAQCIRAHSCPSAWARSVQHPGSPAQRPSGWCAEKLSCRSGCRFWKHRRKSNKPQALQSGALPHPLYEVSGGMCFDPACQKAADSAFLIALVIPLLILAAAVVYLFLNPGQRGEEVFDDPDTGAFFQGANKETPERDRFGKLAYRAVSYTPWPVEADAQGERMRIAVGPQGKESLRTFVFERRLAQPSQVLGVSLPRPMGIILEEDKRLQRIFVAGFVEGSVAEQRSKIGKLQQGRGQGDVQEGDVLRACTCTTLEYSTSALLGAKPATKMVTLYGADGQTWPEVMGALRRGSVDDGEVTMIFERYEGGTR